MCGGPPTIWKEAGLATLVDGSRRLKRDKIALPVLGVRTDSTGICLTSFGDD
jgi:hypothetical protein